MNALRRVAVGAAALSLVGAPVRALASQVTPLLIPPVDAVIERDFREPAATWSSGHRGIDYAVATGVRVRAAASGTVRFAGSVAGHLAVTIDHGRGLETTYSILSAMEVHAGDVVGQGAYIGATGVSHPGNPDGLHFGVKLDGNYVDPVDYLGPVDVSHALHLAPLVRPSLPGGDGDSEGIEGADTRPAGCSAPGALASRPVAPNNHIAVAIAGIASDTNGTTTPDIYTSEFGPLALGYPAANVYYFSYKGDKGPHLHRPYSRSETYGDRRLAAARLRRLLLDIATRHPAADVDVIAHSQGGVVGARDAREAGRVVRPAAAAHRPPRHGCHAQHGRAARTRRPGAR
jgi:hypothetical protein